MNTIFAVFGMGGMEMIVVFGAILLLFGAKKLPELAKGLGQGIREFKKASSEVTEEISRSMDEPPSYPTAPPQKQLPPPGAEAHSTPKAEDSKPDDHKSA